MTTGNIRTYSEIITLKTYEERFDYLKIGGQVGRETFGYDRYLNQILYNTKQWKKFRREIIIRDNACDLACEGYEINYRILVHHINPITTNGKNTKRHMSLATLERNFIWKRQIVYLFRSRQR